MTVFTKSIEIGSPKTKVWDTLANLGDIYRFNPNLTHSYYASATKEGIGASRICELKPSGKISETVVDWQPGHGFTLKIDPIEKAPPVKDFTGKFELQELSRYWTKVSVTIAYQTKLGVLGVLLDKIMLRGKMEGSMVSLLEGLKDHMENGHELNNLNHPLNK